MVTASPSPSRPSSAYVPLRLAVLLVDVDLREVGVVREVEGEALGEAVLGVEPALRFARRTGARGEVPLRIAQRVRREHGQPLRRDLPELDRSRAREAIEIELAGNERPIGVLALAADAARDVEPPRLLAAVAVAKRRVGNPEFGI